MSKPFHSVAQRIMDALVLFFLGSRSTNASAKARPSTDADSAKPIASAREILGSLYMEASGGTRKSLKDAVVLAVAKGVTINTSGKLKGKVPEGTIARVQEEFDKLYSAEPDADAAFDALIYQATVGKQGKSLFPLSINLKGFPQACILRVGKDLGQVRMTAVLLKRAKAFESTTVGYSDTDKEMPFADFLKVREEDAKKIAEAAAAEDGVSQTPAVTSAPVPIRKTGTEN